MAGVSSAIRSINALGFPAPYPPWGVPCGGGSGGKSAGFSASGSDSFSTSSSFTVTTVGGASGEADGAGT